MSVVGGCTFVQVGVIGECHRDGYRQSRVLKGVPWVVWAGPGRGRAGQGGVLRGPIETCHLGKGHQKALGVCGAGAQTVMRSSRYQTSARHCSFFSCPFAGDAEGYRLYTLDHGSGSLRLDLQHRWDDPGRPRPITPGTPLPFFCTFRPLPVESLPSPARQAQPVCQHLEFALGRHGATP